MLKAVHLFVHDTDLAALNVMSSRGGAFGDDAEHVALIFAPHAAVAMSRAHKQDGLRRAIVALLVLIRE